MARLGRSPRMLVIDDMDGMLPRTPSGYGWVAHIFELVVDGGESRPRVTGRCEFRMERLEDRIDIPAERTEPKEGAWEGRTW